MNHGRKGFQSYCIVLLLDNAGCHPHDIEGKYSNIKVIWLPANTTSKLQPLDLGIIQNFKTYYRKLLLKYVLSKIDECDRLLNQSMYSLLFDG